jgi:hypothetical protein
MEGKGTAQERDFEARSAAGIFGAPISWVALVGALMGALSLVPFIFYPFGGGFMSAGMGVMGPLGGMLLGPWAGAVAGFIGGIIGMMISPGAYPLGFVDVALSGVLIPFSWGLLHPKYRKIALVWYPLMVVGFFIFPYHFPGERIGLGGVQEPQYLLTWAYGWIGMLVYVFFAPRIWKLYASEERVASIVGLYMNNLLATIMWVLIWVFPWMGLIRFPYETALANNVINLWSSVLPVSVTSTVLGYFLIRAIRRGNLRRIEGTWVTMKEEVEGATDEELLAA